MRHHLAAVGLLPVLIVQAVYVKCTTPKLPEPAGERNGVAGAGIPLSLLILGDSAAAGVGVSTQAEALSGQLALKMGTTFRLTWRLLAQTGFKAKDVLSELASYGPERFDVAVTSIGVNDVTHGTGIEAWIKSQRRIIETLRSKFKVRHILLSGVPPMHLFPALPQPLRWYFGGRARQFNAALKQLAGRYRECEFVGINFSLEKSAMADDGFHPGAPAYSLWAEHAAAIIQNRLTGKNDLPVP